MVSLVLAASVSHAFADIRSALVWAGRLASWYTVLGAIGAVGLMVVVRFLPASLRARYDRGGIGRTWWIFACSTVLAIQAVCPA